MKPATKPRADETATANYRNQDRLRANPLNTSLRTGPSPDVPEECNKTANRDIKRPMCAYSEAIKNRVH
jgi:hypothetical protein